MCGSTGFLAQGGEILGVGLTYSPIPFIPIHWTLVSVNWTSIIDNFLVSNCDDGKQDEGSVIPVPGPGGSSSKVCDSNEDPV